MARASRTSEPLTYELSALQSVLPQALIDEVLTRLDRMGQRTRLLPPQVIVWLIIGMGLFRSLSIRNVLLKVRRCMEPTIRWGRQQLPHGTSITQARDRLGFDACREIFQRFSQLLESKHADQDMWLGKRVRVVDATTLRTPDTDENEAGFGRPGVSRGGDGSAFPQLRAVTLLGAWTHVIYHVAFGPYRLSELKLVRLLLEYMADGMLLLFDRLYYSYAWLVEIRARRADFLLRIKEGPRTAKLRKREQLGPGDWSARFFAPKALRRRQPSLPEYIDVRMIVRRRRGFRPVTLITSLLDHEAYPADEIAALYKDRWETELAYRELKTYLGDGPVTFRSMRPDRVHQELCGLLIAYNCVRSLISEASRRAGVPPTRMSFTDSLELIRAALERFARGGAEQLDSLTEELASCRLPKRRQRTCERAVKIKMSKYPRKRRTQPAASSRSRRSKSQLARVLGVFEAA